MIVSKVYKQILYTLSNFKLFNETVFKVLFPNYEDLLVNVHVLLVVGCPEPYDAMFKEYEGTEYIVFDLIRLASYVEQGYSVEDLVTQLIIHEFTHQCINQIYPCSKEMTYEEKLNYIVFNEGMAHFLAFKSSIHIDWESELYRIHYENVKSLLMKALQATSKDKQLEWLERADTGSYWNKFGAIAGKIYFGLHKDELFNIYKKGYKDICYRILDIK